MAFKASYANERLLRFSHAQSLKFICGSTRKSLKLDLYVALNLSRHVFFFKCRSTKQTHFDRKLAKINSKTLSDIC
jgi:hypothetical protein